MASLVQDAPPLGPGNSQLPEPVGRSSSPPDQPTIKQPIKTKNVPLGESPGLSNLEEVAQAGPAATTKTPVAAEPHATKAAGEEEDDDAYFSDIPERPSHHAEELPMSSPAAPSAITAGAAPSTSRTSAQQTAAEHEIYEDSEPAEFQPATPAAEEETAAAGADDAPAIFPHAAAAASAAPAPTPARAPAGSNISSISLKGIPKVAADAAVHASQAYVEAGKQARVTLQDLLSLREKEGPPVTLTVDQIATAVFFLLLLLQLLLLPLFLPSTFRLLYSLTWGLCLGLWLSFLFYHNRKRKTEANELLATNLGLKGVQLVAAGVPSVFNVSDEEKMEWLNALVMEVWPFVDKGVCKMIQDITAQMMPGILQSLPASMGGLVKSVGFKHLTFGAMPFRVESIRVANDRADELVVELAVKWCGDPNITLAIEIPAGQKLCPRVLDISFAAKLRLVLRPLVSRLPGFVALMATVPKPPLIKYRLDFGKALGGSVAPRAVTPVVNYFLRGVLDRMLVWPNRIVVPILQETAQDAAEVQKLMRRVQGMVRVCVLNGKRLKGLEPTDSACVELTTDTEYVEATRPRAAVRPEELAAVDGKLDRLANTELVTWEDYIYLLVQEPESQMMRVEAFDLTTSVAKAGSVNSRRPIGRAMVKLNRVCRHALQGATSEPYQLKINLGEGDWGAPGGPGKGAGSIALKASYFPCENFTQEQVLGSEKGIILVRLLAISGLTPSITGNVAAYAAINVAARRRAGKPSWRTARQYWTLAGHMAELKARIARLDAARQRALREGDAAAAAAREAELVGLREDLELAGERGKVVERRVTLDYSMETQALTAFHRVVERIPALVINSTGGEGGDRGASGRDHKQQQQHLAGAGAQEEENTVIIKVIQEGRVKKAAETLGTVEVPVSRIRTAYCLNPLSGKKEFGLYLPKWRDYDPDQPGAHPPEAEWGLPLQGPGPGQGGGADVRVWAVLRWVPCVEPIPDKPEKEDEEGQREVHGQGA